MMLKPLKSSPELKKVHFFQLIFSCFLFYSVHDYLAWDGIIYVLVKNSSFPPHLKYYGNNLMKTPKVCPCGYVSMTLFPS